MWPLITPDRGTTVINADYRSCYKTTNKQLKDLNHKLTITFTLATSVMQHCIVLVQDLYGDSHTSYSKRERQ